MHQTDTSFRPLRPPGRGTGRLRRRGFNFAEVLFAVMILGIGFIMVAAIFPVALTQTRTTGEEVVASTVARGGVNYFQQAGLTARTLPATDLLLVPPTAVGVDYWPNQVAAVADPSAGALVVPAGGRLQLPGKMVSFRDNRFDPIIRDAIWRQVSGNMILPEDPRVAWVGMYRRGITYTNTTGVDAAPGDPGVTAKADAFAHFVIIGTQVRNRSMYEPAKDLRRYPDDMVAPALVSPTTGTLEPVTVYAKLTERQTNAGDTADTVTFYDGPAAGAGQITAAVAAAGPYFEGAYLVISDDQLGGATDGERNGRVFRLGLQRTDLGTGVWELAPDGDLSLINPDGIVGNADDVNENIPARPVTSPNVTPPGLPAVAFIVGRGRTDPTAPAGDREGVAQDTGVYVTLVPAN